MTDNIRFKVAAFNPASLASLAIVFSSIFATSALLLDDGARLGAFALTFSLLLLVVWHMVCASVTFAPDALRVGAGLFIKRISYGDIVGTSRDRANLRLGWRMGGIGFPGFALGWFSGAGGKRLFVATGRSAGALRLNLRGKFDVVVGVDDPEALRNALRPYL